MACYDFFILAVYALPMRRYLTPHNWLLHMTQKVMLVSNTARLTVADARGGALR